MAIEKEVTIVNTYGFHVRPATAFLKLANEFSCEVTLSSQGNVVKGDSAMGLISLGAVQGDKVIIACDGEDEENALNALVELIESSFNGID